MILNFVYVSIKKLIEVCKFEEFVSYCVVVVRLLLINRFLLVVVFIYFNLFLIIYIVDNRDICFRNEL